MSEEEYITEGVSSSPSGSSMYSHDETTDLEDYFNLELSVTVVETEADEIDNEFVDAVTEIEGKKSFPCDKCDKVCKSKGGLTRHKNSKHAEQENLEESCVVLLDEDTVCGFVEAIKARIIEEDLYGAETNKALSAVSSTKALFTAVLPIYKTFTRKKNQDKMLESFYGLIPQSCELLTCEDYRIANLIMIQLPDFLIGFCNRTNMTSNQTEGDDSVSKLDPAEYGPLSYIAGYIVSKLHQKNRSKKNNSNEEIQTLLHAMKSTDTTQEFISVRSRGGLVSPTADLVGILEVAELSFRSEVNNAKDLLRNIPIDLTCSKVLDFPVVRSLWENIVMSSGIDTSSPTQKLCLENVVKLYLRVRSFSYVRDFITKYKIKEKQTKSKALRKELKKADRK